MVKAFQIRLSKEVIEDLTDIPERYHQKFGRILSDLRQKGPKIGTKLEKRRESDLSDCWKFYFSGTRYRVVYRVNRLDENVIDVLLVGFRTPDLYSRVSSRIKKHETVGCTSEESE